MHIKKFFLNSFKYRTPPGYQPQYPSNSNNQEKTNYILRLNKKQIFFFLATLFTVFGLFFLLGIFTGYKITSNSSYANSIDNPNFNSNPVNEEIINQITNMNFVSEQVSVNEKFENQEFLKELPNKLTKKNLSSVDSQSKKNPQKKVTKKKSTKKPVAQKKKITKKVKKPVSPPQEVKSTVPKEKINYVRKPEPGVTYYYLQVIATLDVGKARKIFEELKERDYPAVVKVSNKDDQMTYAIRVGLYTDKNTALRHLRLIRKGGGYTETFIKSYKVE